MTEYNEMYEYNDEDGGIQFQPYEDELINEYLITKLEGKPRSEITTKDVYSKEPWLLDHPMGTFFKKNEWYYFATRTQISKQKIGCGKKAKRKITRDDDSGFWRANAKYDIPDTETKMTIGKKQTLAFVKSDVNNKKKQKSGDGTSCDVVAPGSEGSWIMTEYMLPEIEDKFRELVICKIHVVENSNNKKKKDDSHEASTSSYHHHVDHSTSAQQPINSVDHGTLLTSTSGQQPINYVDHETLLASTSAQQPINSVYHGTLLAHTSAQQPINSVDHGTLLTPYLEQQPVNIVDHETFLAHTSAQQPINSVDHRTFLAPYLEQQPMNIVDHGTLLAPYLEQQPNNIVGHGTFPAPYLEQQPMNLYHESFLASFSLEQQPTNNIWNIQENNKMDYHEAFIPHHHESLADYSTMQQPVNEAHGHVPEIPLIGSEKNDQVFEASRQVPEKDEQRYIDAPIEEGRGGEWIPGFINSLTTMNTSSRPMVEDDGLLIYNTSSLIDQDLLDQYATLRPKIRSKL